MKNFWVFFLFLFWGLSEGSAFARDGDDVELKRGLLSSTSVTHQTEVTEDKSGNGSSPPQQGMALGGDEPPSLGTACCGGFEHYRPPVIEPDLRDSRFSPFFEANFGGVFQCFRKTTLTNKVGNLLQMLEGKPGKPLKNVRLILVGLHKLPANLLINLTSSLKRLTDNGTEFIDIKAEVRGLTRYAIESLVKALSPQTVRVLALDIGMFNDEAQETLAAILKKYPQLKQFTVRRWNVDFHRGKNTRALRSLLQEKKIEYTLLAADHCLEIANICPGACPYR